MRKEEFLQKLRQAAGRMHPLERERMLEFYNEVIEDRVEEGVGEEAAVESLGPVERIVAKALAEQEKAALDPPRSAGWFQGLSAGGKTLFIILLIFGGPIALSVAAGLAAAALSLYLAAWICIASLYIAAAALAVCAVTYLFPLARLMPMHLGPALFQVGTCLFAAGLAIFAWLAAVKLTKLFAAATVRFCRWLFHRRKGGGAI